MKTETVEEVMSQGKVLVRTEYPARWEAPQPKETLIGIYEGAEDWTTKDGKPAKTYLLKLSQASDEALVTVGPNKDKKDIPASEWYGKIVGLTGKYLSGLSSVAVGVRVGVRFDGMGPQVSRGKQPAKLFTVAVIG